MLALSPPATLQVHLASPELAAAEGVLLYMARTASKRGDPLPRADDLAHLLGVSVDDVTLGLQFLVREKWIKAQRTRYQCSRPAPPRPAGINLRDHPSTFELLRASQALLRPLLAGLAPGAPNALQCRLRLQSMADAGELDVLSELGLIIVETNDVIGAVYRKVLRSLRSSLLPAALALLDDEEQSSIADLLRTVADTLAVGAVAEPCR